MKGVVSLRMLGRALTPCMGCLLALCLRFWKHGDRRQDLGMVSFEVFTAAFPPGNEVVENVDFSLIIEVLFSLFIYL